MIELVLPSVKYKDSFIAAVKDIKRNGNNGFVSPSVQRFAEYDMARLENDFENYIVNPLLDLMKGINLPKEYVPGTDFWIIKDGTFVGRVGLRHRLNDHLLKYAGHIGYMVVPAYRRQGIGKKALELCLQKAKEIGIDEALLTCHEKNFVSKHLIEQAMHKFGGHQDYSEKEDGEVVLRYWIKTTI